MSVPRLASSIPGIFITPATASVAIVVGLLVTSFSAPNASAQQDKGYKVPASIADSEQPPTKSRTIVLSIGISKFKDSYWQNLNFAASDAAAINASLSAGNPDAEGTFLNGAEATSRDALIKALEGLGKKAIGPTDTVLIYISSHGTIDQNIDRSLSRYIVTSDTDHGAISETALSYERLVTLFKALPSRKKALILDFCHSGTGKSQLTPEIMAMLQNRKGKLVPDPFDDDVEGEYILAASEWGEPALEDPVLGRSVYTHFLLEGFSRDLNLDGAVSLTEAHSYARSKVHAYTEGKQTPTAVMNITGVDPIIVSGRVSEGRSFVYSFIDRLKNFEVYVNQVPKGDLGQGFAVPAGKVHLKIVDRESGATVVDQLSSFVPGKEYSLSSIIDPIESFSVDAEATVMNFWAEQVSSFGPKLFKGPSVTGTAKRILWGWDLGFNLAVMEAEETRSEYFRSHSLTQKSQAFFLSPQLGLEYKLHSNKNSWFRGLEWHHGGGPVVGYIKRERRELNASEGAFTPGLQLSGRLVARVFDYRFRTGFALAVSTMQNPVKDSTSPLANAAQASIFAGYSF